LGAFVPDFPWGISFPLFPGGFRSRFFFPKRLIQIKSGGATISKIPNLFQPGRKARGSDEDNPDEPLS